jgi:hypothetical protein
MTPACEQGSFFISYLPLPHPNSISFPPQYFNKSSISSEHYRKRTLPQTVLGNHLQIL